MADIDDIDAVRPRLRLGVGALIALVLLGLVVTVVLTLIEKAPGAEERVVTHQRGAVDGAGTDVFVHVAGAVGAPGVYRLPAGSRLMDAIAAAGGFTSDAARDRINLARGVDDGEQLHVPFAGEGESDGATGEAAAGAGRVSINTATAAELEALPGIGPALAQRIVAWREENGRFRALDELLGVAGIGPKVFASLREHIAL